jgi:predicted nucleic acid-binding Zn ribbon protein
MSGDLYTYLCEDCEEIVDVLYRYGEKPEKIICPECGSENLKMWNPRTGKCPKCKGKMKKTDIILMVD